MIKGQNGNKNANFPIKKTKSKATVKMFKTSACKKHITACNRKPGKKSKAEFQNNRLYMVPLIL